MAGVAWREGLQRVPRPHREHLREAPKELHQDVDDEGADAAELLAAGIVLLVAFALLRRAMSGRRANEQTNVKFDRIAAVEEEAAIREHGATQRGASMACDGHGDGGSGCFKIHT